MAKAIRHTSGTAGGYIVGRPHSENGVKAINKSTGQPLEMQGGEVIITDTAVADPTLREFDGKQMTNRQILSAINESGGGVAFAESDIDLPQEIRWFETQSYQYGGETMNAEQVVKKISDCGCAAKLEKGGLVEIEYNLLYTNAGGVDVVSNTKDYDKESRDYRTLAHVDKSGNIKYIASDIPDYIKAEIEAFYAKRHGLDPSEIATDETPSINPADYKNPYEVNRAVERLLDANEQGDFTPEQIEFIALYSGYGGLDKFGATGKGILYEYFTPDAVVKKMWALAYKYGFGEIITPRVFEPSVGTGNFFKYAPTGAVLEGNEINTYSARICRILYPTANITLQSFEQNFISRNKSIGKNLKGVSKYDLIIGNPPYGKADSKFMGMGEADFTRAGNFTEYFITRGLDILNPDGLLVFIVGAEQYNGGTLFLDGGNTPVKEQIFAKAELLDAWRLPTKIFERTGVASEILVFKKRSTGNGNNEN